MNTYIISCPSSCGTYFQPYLQSLTVNAGSVEDAIMLAKCWMKDHKENFVEDEKQWQIDKLSSDIGVVGWEIEADY